MQQQILVPLDGSALAESILPYAGALARATASTLKLLQVKPPPLVDMEVNGMTSILENWQKQALDAAHTYLAGVAARLQSAGLVVQAEVLEGDPATCIVSSAEQDPNLLLIVMATHGRGEMRRWIFGSVTSKVLHTCPKPLLLRRPPGTHCRCPARSRTTPSSSHWMAHPLQRMSWIRPIDSLRRLVRCSSLSPWSLPLMAPLLAHPAEPLRAISRHRSGQHIERKLRAGGGTLSTKPCSSAKGQDSPCKQRWPEAKQPGRSWGSVERNMVM